LLTKTSLRLSYSILQKTTLKDVILERWKTFKNVLLFFILKKGKIIFLVIFGLKIITVVVVDPWHLPINNDHELFRMTMDYLEGS